MLLLNEPVNEQVETGEQTTEQEQEVTAMDIIEQELGIETEGKKVETVQQTTEYLQSEEEPEHKPEVSVVTDDMIAKYPALTTLKGKPSEEIAKSYQNMMSDYQITKKKLAEIEKQSESKTEDLGSKKEEEEPEEIPDPLLDKEGYTEYLLKRSKGLSPEEVKKMMDEEYERRKEEERAFREKQVKAKEKEKEMMGMVSEAIPEGLDPYKAIATYLRANPQLLDEKGKPKEEAIQFFENNPLVFANNVGAFIVKNLTQDEINRRAKEEAFTFTKNNLKQSEKASIQPSIPRKQPVLDGTDKLVSQIIENAYDERDWKNST